MDFPASNLTRVEQRDGEAGCGSSSSFSACSGRRARCRSPPPRKAYHWCSSATTRSRASSTSSTIASCSCSFAPGRMRGRSPSTTGRRPTASSPISARRSASAPAPTQSRQHPGRREAGVRRPARRAGEVRLAAARRRQRLVRRRGRDRRVRRQLARVRGGRSHDARRAAAARSASDMLLGAQRLQRPGQVPDPHLRRDSRSIMRFLPTGDLCEPLADAVFFYIGDQLDWDVELAIPAGAVEPVAARHSSASSAGPAGWRRTGPTTDAVSSRRALPSGRAHAAQAYEPTRR